MCLGMLSLLYSNVIYDSLHWMLIEAFHLTIYKKNEEALNSILCNVQLAGISGNSVSCIQPLVLLLYSNVISDGLHWMLIKAKMNALNSLLSS